MKQLTVIMFFVMVLIALSVLLPASESQSLQLPTLDLTMAATLSPPARLTPRPTATLTHIYLPYVSKEAAQ